MPSTSTLAAKVRSLVADSRELERLRKAHASLMIEIKSLRQGTAEIATLLGASTRGPGRPRKNAMPTASAPKSAAPKAAPKSGGKRFRTSTADVDKMYKALTAKAPSDWKTKAEILKAAGLNIDKSAAAWKRVTEGFSFGGKKHAPVLKSNGSRGFKGRYRKV